LCALDAFFRASKKSWSTCINLGRICIALHAALAVGCKCIAFRQIAIVKGLLAAMAFQNCIYVGK
jgi:hypothetical protein